MDKVDSKDLGNNTQLSLLGAHEKLGREHCDLSRDHIELKLEFKILKFQLKDKIQQVVDLEKQLARVLDNNTQLRLLGE